MITVFRAIQQLRGGEMIKHLKCSNGCESREILPFKYRQLQFTQFISVK